MKTARAASSLQASATATATANQPQRPLVASHQANSSGVITSASGWKCHQLIHSSDGYSRKQPATATASQPLRSRSRASRNSGTAPSAIQTVSTR